LSLLNQYSANKCIKVAFSEISSLFSKTNTLWQPMVSHEVGLDGCE